MSRLAEKGVCHWKRRNLLMVGLCMVLVVLLAGCFGGKKTQQTPPGSFNLLIPANGATDVSINPMLTWSTAPGATSYTLVVADNQNFTNPLFNQNVGNVTSKQISGLAYSTTYYWKVTAHNTAGSTEASNSGISFTTSTQPGGGEGLIGFAACGPGTTGGAGGRVVVVTSGQQLYDLMKPRENKDNSPLIVYIQGTLTFNDKVDIKRTKNISILGLGNDAKLLGFGLKLVEAENIIIRNITFADCRAGEKDALTIEESKYVWVDHCDFTDSPAYDPDGTYHDGLLDIKKGSAYITVSWNRFTNHRKTCLLGHSTSETGDVNIKVTYHHNWFDGTHSRHPRARYGQVHIFNNYYSNIPGYGVGVTCQAQIFLEANYFENTPTPVLISQVNDPDRVLSGEPPGYVKAVGNYTLNSGQILEYQPERVFNPGDYYPYASDNVQDVKNIVMAWAGARLNLSP